MWHLPVMSREVLEHLAVREDGNYLDATAGLGGHAALIAERLKTGLVIANDRDLESLRLAEQNTRPWAARIRFHHGRFSELDKALAKFGIGQVDGLLADLGVSRYQLTDPERGFSLYAEAPLDMRMDRTWGITAAEIVNHFKEEDLADLLYRFGEERRSRRVARAILRARPIRNCRHLAEVVESAVKRRGRLHPATKTFMALRIAVNREMEELDALLELAPRLTAPGGRIVIISFMSLEDRKVKHSFQHWERAGTARILTRKPVRPSPEEVRANPAARSGLLRAAELLRKAAAPAVQRF